METYIPMYNENDKPDLTGTESETTENNDNSSGAYGGSFKDYTYSTYDYNSFYDENYSNSYDKANNTTDNSESQTSYSSTVDKLDDNKVSETLSDDSDSIDSFKVFDNLNSVDSFDDFDILENANSINQNPSSNNIDATVYLDEFLQESIDFYNSIENAVSSKHKKKEINIPGCIVLSLFGISLFMILFGGVFTNSILSTMHNFAAIFAVVLFFITILLGIKPSIFLSHDDFRSKEINLQNIEDRLDTQKVQYYLDSVGKTTFKANKSYCLTGATFYGKKKSLSLKYALLTILLLFVICNTFGYIMMSSQIPVLLTLNFLLCFASAGIVFLFVGIIEPSMRIKSGLYSEPINAVCVEVDSHMSTYHRNGHTSHHRVYQPILYVRYNGHKYIIFDNLFTNTYIPYVGELIQITVNKNNPSDYEIVSSKTNNNYLMIGIVFFLIPLCLFIYMVMMFH